MKKEFIGIDVSKKTFRAIFKLKMFPLGAHNLEYIFTDINTKDLIIFMHKKMFFERTFYFGFNSLKSRSKSLIELNEIEADKERGLSLLTRSQSQ